MDRHLGCKGGEVCVAGGMNLMLHPLPYFILLVYINHNNHYFHQSLYRPVNCGDAIIPTLNGERGSACLFLSLIISVPMDMSLNLPKKLLCMVLETALSSE